MPGIRNLNLNATTLLYVEDLPDAEDHSFTTSFFCLVMLGKPIDRF